MKHGSLALFAVLCLGCKIGPAHAEPAKNMNGLDSAQASVRIEGNMLRLHLPANATPHHPSPKSLPRSSQEWLDQMLDSSRHGTAFKDPQAFVEWLDAITEPQFMTALATASIDPKTYPRALNTLIRPETARNWAEFTNPLLYLRWMMTGSNPDFYNAIIERLADPGKTKRWAQYSTTSGPVAPLLKAGTPDLLHKSLVTAAPETIAPMAKMANPGTLITWVGGFVDGVAHPARFQTNWQRLPAGQPPAISAPTYRY